MRHLSDALLALAIAAAPVAAQQYTPPGQGPNQGPLEVVAPSAQYPTLQAAVDAVAHGGFVRIPAGTWTERVVVSGKIVHLIGLGAKANQVRLEADGAGPIVYFVAGGGGSVQRLTLAGGTDGIAGHAAGEVSVDDVRIDHSGAHGIAGSFDALAVVDSSLRHSGLSGIAVTPVGDLALANVDIRHSGGAGAVVFNQAAGEGALRAVSDLRLTHNGHGGLEVRGGAVPVVITGVTAIHNAGFGIRLIGAHGTRIDASSASWTRPATVAGALVWGDGLGVFRSENVTLAGSTFSFNHRAGASFWGCADGRPTSFEISGSQLDKNAFALELGPLTGCTAGRSVTPGDGGDNICDGGGCKAQTSGLAPVELPAAD